MSLRYLVLVILLVSALFMPRLALATVTPCEPEPVDTAISYGQTSTCILDAPGDSDVFRFPGVAGEVVTAEATRVTGFLRVCIELLDPDGLEVGSSCTGLNNVEIRATLPKTGVFAILVRGEKSNLLGNYALQLDRLSPSSPAATLIEFGESLPHALEVQGDRHVAVFTGKKNDMVRIQAARDGSGIKPCVEVFGEDGSSLAPEACLNTPDNEITLSLPETGTFSVLVWGRRGDSWGDFTLSLLCLSASCVSTVAKHNIEWPGQDISGVHGLGGWKCPQYGQITVRVDGGPPLTAARNLPRGDTSGACDNAGNNGFLTILNYWMLGSGEHEAVFYDGGKEFARKTFSVATLGPDWEPRALGLSAEFTLHDFPETGTDTMIGWREGLQGFVVEGVEGP